jgi:hypothetical protein
MRHMLSVLLVTCFPGLNLVLRICASGFAYIGLGDFQLFIVFGSAFYLVSRGILHSTMNVDSLGNV